ncbi:MAG: glycosyltransferase, partial [Patescibacteria group bacterium]
FEQANIRTIFLKNLTRNIYLLSEIFGFIEILQTLKREKPHILHLNSSKASGIGAFWGRLIGIPKIIYTVHGWPFNENRNWLTKKIIYFFSWLTCFFCHQVIVINRQDLAQGQNMLGQRRKMHLIYNGLKAPDFITKEEARLQLAQICQTKLEPTDIIGVTVAELHPNKGLATLIDAISKTTSNFKYIIIGEGDMKDKLRRLIEEKNLTARVFLAGFVSEAIKYLKAFDFFVLPSVKEGHPYTLLEAGMAYLPAIGSDIPGIRDILAETGNPLFPTGDVDKLAEYLDGLAGNEEIRQVLGAKLHDYVATNFSFERTLERTSALYI